MSMAQTHLAPTGGPAALGMLDQEMGGPDLAWLSAFGWSDGAAVVLGHVDLELLDVGTGWWLPA